MRLIEHTTLRPDDTTVAWALIVLGLAVIAGAFCAALKWS